MQKQQATIGQDLRRAREEKRLSYDDVSAQTRIQADYIQAIERLDTDALPSLGYVLGFVRAYAQCVGLNGVDAVARYKQDISAPKNLTVRDRALFISKRTIRLPSGFVSAVLVIGFAVSGALWYGWQTGLSPSALTPPTAQAEVNVNPARQSARIDATSGHDFIPHDISTDPNTLTLKAVGPSWVEIKDANARVLVSRIFIGGESWQTPVDSGVILDARDGGALALYRGSTLIGHLGDVGRPISGLVLEDALRPKLAGISGPAFEAPQ